MSSTKRAAMLQQHLEHVDHYAHEILRVGRFLDCDLTGAREKVKESAERLIDAPAETDNEQHRLDVYLHAAWGLEDDGSLTVTQKASIMRGLRAVAAEVIKLSRQS